MYKSLFDDDSKDIDVFKTSQIWLSYNFLLIIKFVHENGTLHNNLSFHLYYIWAWRVGFVSLDSSTVELVTPCGAIVLKGTGPTSNILFHQVGNNIFVIGGLHLRLHILPNLVIIILIMRPQNKKRLKTCSRLQKNYFLSKVKSKWKILWKKICFQLKNYVVQLWKSITMSNLRLLIINT
jgi:hypothetical protein